MEGLCMGKLENPGIWEKIQKSVQETERLMGQKKYNLSMIKARQTLEYMVKLQCDKAGIVESTPETMIQELFKGGWIKKNTAEHYLQLLALGNTATKDGDNSAYNANQAYHILSQEIYAFVDADKNAKQRRSSAPRSKQSKSRKPSSASKGIPSQDLLKLLIPVGLIVILIIVISIFTPKKDANDETTTVSATTEAQIPETKESEQETEESVSVSYKTTTTLNVRSGPSTDSDRIGKLDPDKNVEFLRDYDDFWAVIMYNDQEAYVAKEYLVPAE